MTHRHPIFARLYPRIAQAAETHGTAEHRQLLLLGLEGRVLEVGAGNGLNFRHYPPAVTEVVAVEPEPHLRALAQRAAARVAVRIEVIEGTAEDLPLADGEFDAAVVSLVLCSVPDQAAALEEIRRVLRPGGGLRFYEHVISDSPGAVRLQRLLDATIYPHLAGGCHCGRDTAAAIRAAGFSIERLERIPMNVGPLDIPHILGAARRG